MLRFERLPVRECGGHASITAQRSLAVALQGENAIGRLRRRLPRKTDLTTLSARQLARIVKAYNQTPRKCLDFKTPAEAFSLLKSTVALQT